MSPTRILLVSLGLAAAVGIPAIALARSGGSEPTCCDTPASCCSKQATARTQADPTITCPLTGETIKASECPLCKSRK